MVGRSGTGRRDEGGVRHGSILRDIHFSYMHIGCPPSVAVEAATRRRQIATSAFRRPCLAASELPEADAPIGDRTVDTDSAKELTGTPSVGADSASQSRQLHKLAAALRQPPQPDAVDVNAATRCCWRGSAGCVAF